MDALSFITLNTECLSRASRQEIATLSRNYPFNSELLVQFGVYLNWDELSLNQQINWTEELIAQFSGYLNWKVLSTNSMLPWNEHLLEKFEDNWNWQALGTKAWRCNRDKVWCTDYPLMWTEGLFKRFSEKIYWAYPVWQDGEIECFTGLINHPNIIWTPELYLTCDQDIINHFKLLNAEVSDVIIQQEDLNCYNKVSGQWRHWTYYQSWANWEGEARWSFEYLELLLQLSTSQPNTEFINWDMISLPLKIRSNPQFEPLCRIYGLAQL